MEQHAKSFLVYLEHQLDYSDSTLIAYRSDLESFVAYLKDKHEVSPVLSDLNDTEVSHFLRDEKDKGRRQSTLTRRYSTLRQFTHYLSEQGLIDASALLKDSPKIIQAIAGAVPTENVACLTDPEVDKLLNTLESDKRPRSIRDLAILSILLETGISVNTLIELTLADVDLAQERLRLRLDSNRERWLTLRKSFDHLKIYLEEGRPQLCRSSSEQGLFISQMGGHMRRQGIWQILRHWGENAGLSVTLSPRLVRQTAALHLARAGFPASEIGTLMGHHNPLSTQALLRRLSDSSR